MDYRMQADDSADTANRRKTYIKQSGRGMRKSPKRFCLLTFVLIGDAPEIQQKIAGALNGVEALVQGGCKAFAEDASCST